ncbi:hypothetical protein Afil01_43380 [Actinorhabdospora filicis]|uniref:Uncharacterized protein n=1 Tax=Actinorhabdospora filicis TaxID=1785913 RepID=A0A9W6SP28_9ACTN|nr:hypothetical protein [Actinorhabdospora filicis]GLZ79531.1 hypothetical protein Afil01_43380 [Actinorhabdospora filicis]
MVRGRTNPPRAAQAKGAKVVSAWLENADVFRTAKGGGPAPNGPAILVLKRRPDFHKADFDRKAKDLERLGREGKLKKAESKRTKVRDKKTGKDRTRTNVHRDRMIRRLTKNGRKYQANKELVRKLYGGKKNVTKVGDGLDPDHIHELQLDGKDIYGNLRMMDAYTNRHLGREISVALRDVPPGTPVIVKVIP